MQLIVDVWNSLRALPLWVQVWVFVILVPVNMAAIFFIGAPGGWLIAVLAIGGMAPNMVLIFVERGFSKAMALSHLLFWIPLGLVIWGALGRGDIEGRYLGYLWLLLSVDLISLAFDVPDSWKWWRGDRGVAR